MKSILATLFATITLSGCSDAMRASLSAYGEEATITCYSGGEVIFDDVSTGKIATTDGDGVTFKSKKTGNYVRAFADCIVTSRLQNDSE